ncbi:MAG: response regulator [Fibrobacterota bacterium]
MNICIIDDSKDITDLLREYLLTSSSIRCRVRTFNNPQTAIEYLLNSEETDVLITDMHMGNLSGFDVIKALGKPATKMVISGHISNRELRALEKMGIEFYDKPINIKKLIQDITKSATA